MPHGRSGGGVMALISLLLRGFWRTIAAAESRLQRTPGHLTDVLSMQERR
jgi:hypothetical protein